MNPIRSVLVAPGAVYLLATSLVGRLPTAMAALAIVQLVRMQGGGFDLAGIMTAAYVIASAVGQPALGRWIDRVGQTIVMLVAGIAGSAGFVGMAIFAADAAPLAVAGAVLAGLFTPPLEPALRSLWPSMVPAGAPLKAAFSLDAGAQELVFIAGPLLTIVGISAFGATGNVFFAAALGLGGTLAFAAHRLSRDARPAKRSATPHTSPLASGPFRRVVLLQVGVGIPIGVLTIAATSYGESAGLPEFAGWALAANAVGALVGATVSALRPARRSPVRLLALFGALLGFGYLPLAATQLPVPAILVFAAIAGIMLPPVLTQVFDWVHAASNPAALTEANAWVISGLNVGIAAGTTGSGFVIGALGASALPVVVLAGSAITLLSALLVLPAFLRGANAEAAVGVPAL